MDDAKIQELLSDLPPKVLRSKLEPYSPLILEMQRRGLTYRRMAQVLTEKCQLAVAPGTVHDFLRVRTKSKPRTKPVTPDSAKASESETEKPGPTAATEKPTTEDRDTIRKRIAALKNRPIPQKEKPAFVYNADEPLKLIPQKNNTE